MRTTPEFEPRTLDLAVVMAAGSRLRRRRRFAVGAASGLAVLALLVGGAQFIRPQAAPPTTTAPAAPAASAADPDPAPSDAGSREVLGEVVGTGLRDKTGELALWVVAAEPVAPFGIVAGRRLADGSLRPEVLANENVGSARAAGFHAAQAPMEVGGGGTPAFGYYAGPATRITARVAGERIEAKLAAWSEDPSIVLFWFPPDRVKPGAQPDSLTAYDRSGGRLPAGQATFAVG